MAIQTTSRKSNKYYRAIRKWTASEKYSSINNRNLRNKSSHCSTNSNFESDSVALGSIASATHCAQAPYVTVATISAIGYANVLTLPPPSPYRLPSMSRSNQKLNKTGINMLCKWLSCAPFPRPPLYCSFGRVVNAILSHSMEFNNAGAHDSWHITHFFSCSARVSLISDSSEECCVEGGIFREFFHVKLWECVSRNMLSGWRRAKVNTGQKYEIKTYIIQRKTSKINA